MANHQHGGKRPTKKMRPASRHGRVRNNAAYRAVTKPEDPRALKILQDFCYHKKSLEMEKKAAEETPMLYDDTPDKLLTPEEFTSLCYSRTQSPDEILMLKEDEFLDEGKVWDLKYSEYRKAFVSHIQRVREELVRLGGGGWVLEGSCA